MSFNSWPDADEVRSRREKEMSRLDRKEVVDTPFDLENILRACPAMRAKWNEHPFIFDIAESGQVVVTYFSVEDPIWGRSNEE